MSANAKAHHDYRAMLPQVSRVQGAAAGHRRLVDLEVVGGKRSVIAMGEYRFNSWDADPARRTPQQWAVGHYLTLLLGGSSNSTRQIPTLLQLATAGFVEMFPDLYLSGIATVLGKKDTTPLTPPTALPPLIENLPALYVSWGAGVVVSAMERGQTREQIQEAMLAAACNGEQRLVGTLLSPERIVEFRIGNDDERLWADAHFVRDDGQWLKSEIDDDHRPRFYYELLESLQHCPQQLRSERWSTSARLMAVGLAKDMQLHTSLLPIRHFVLKPEATVTNMTETPETTTPAKYVALIAGGPKDRIRELRYKLRSLYDIELRYHWEWHRTNQFRRPLPQDINLVLILSDMIGHAESEKLGEKAKTAGVQTILIPRKTSEIRVTLEREGLVPLPWVEPVAAVIQLRPEQNTAPPPKLRTKPRHPEATSPTPPPEPAPALPTTLQFNHGRGKIMVDCEVLELWLDERTTSGGDTIASEIYQDYCTWCQAYGATPYHNIVFSQWLDRRGFARRRLRQQGKLVVVRALRLKPGTPPVVAPLPVPTKEATPPRKSGPDYDALELFLLERCRTDAGSIGTMPLYSAFSSWCLQHKCRVMTPHAMEKHLHRMKLQVGDQLWRVTLLPSEAEAPPTPASTAVALPGVSNADLRAQVLAKLTEVQSQLAAAGIREVVLTPTDLNIKR
jgi:hypothetical protein